MYFHSFNIGYIDIPNMTTLNIYTVGCPHKCYGCHAADLQDINHIERKELTSKLIIEKLTACKDYYQGICWLGGDPLFQFDEFIKLNQELKLYDKNLIITAYTRI
jgi:anaerobic ribonucleoside-triphosphate reductase activating protein